jgi:hypothetical protein
LYLLRSVSMFEPLETLERNPKRNKNGKGKIDLKR